MTPQLTHSITYLQHLRHLSRLYLQRHRHPENSSDTSQHGIPTCHARGTIRSISRSRTLSRARRLGPGSARRRLAGGGLGSRCLRRRGARRRRCRSRLLSRPRHRPGTAAAARGRREEVQPGRDRHRHQAVRHVAEHGRHHARIVGFWTRVCLHAGGRLRLHGAVHVKRAGGGTCRQPRAACYISTW